MKQNMKYKYILLCTITIVLIIIYYRGVGL